MRNLRDFLARRVVGLFVGAFLLAVAATTLIGLLTAQTPFRNFPPRLFLSQQTHYLRFTVNFNSCVLVSNTCSYKVGAVPYNAFIVRGYQQVTTAFNSGTTDTLAIGTASGGAQLVAAQTVHAGTAGLPLTIVAANLGLVATGNNAAQTGADGGFEIYATYAQTGAAPTAGVAVVILEYFAPNDGSCIAVPLAATAGPC
jgi:hypothetical protein